MPPHPGKKQFKEGEYRKAMRPYATAIGLLVISWNSLHRNLARLFEAILRCPAKKMAMGVWYSTDSDYAQRKMLRAAVETAAHLSEAQKKSIVWTLNQIDDSLRHNRNDVIHAPLATIEGTADDPAALVLTLMPDPESPSPRAISLWKKTGSTGLRKYLREQKALAHVLAVYTAKMCTAISNPANHAWPDKPKLQHAHRS